MVSPSLPHSTRAQRRACGNALLPLPWGCSLHLPLQELSQKKVVGGKGAILSAGRVSSERSTTALLAARPPFKQGRGVRREVGALSWLPGGRSAGNAGGRGGAEGARGREGGAGRGAAGGDCPARAGGRRAAARARGRSRQEPGERGGGGARARAGPRPWLLSRTGPRQLLAGAASRTPESRRRLALPALDAPSASPSRPAAAAAGPGGREAPLRGRTPGSAGEDDER